MLSKRNEHSVKDENGIFTATGNDFKGWIQVTYNNISSCTISKGFSSPFFNLNRGVKTRLPALRDAFYTSRRDIIVRY